jgi:CBS domain containing-hemolysin-like protein
MDTLIWVGIGICLLHSAMFSGLNLAFFSLSRLRLEAEAAAGHRKAAKVLTLRRDSNFLLTTILWGNVGINVLLTLLSNSVMAGVAAFVFSTVVITFLGEIIPQAYFSRSAMTMASFLSPVLRFYQYVLYPVAKPSAWMLDQVLGHEAVEYLKELQLKGVIEQHIISENAEIDFVEGRGALNFLDIDDVPIADEGEVVDPASILVLPTRIDLPVLPEVRTGTDAFVQDVNASGKKWVIITDPEGYPRLVLDADSFLRAVLPDAAAVDPYAHCHRPIIVTDPNSPLGHIIGAMKLGMESRGDAAIDKDIVLLWTPDVKRVITGADLLGRLLRGIDSAAVPAT